MGIIKAVTGAIGGGLADSWLEVIEADAMSDTTVMAGGVKTRKGDKRTSNTRGTADIISDGSVIHVYPNQFMMLLDGGKVVDYTAEEGYYTVHNASQPSMFNGQLGKSVRESFNRVRYGGGSPQAQKVFFINLQEIKGIKFGTRNPINYFDNFYNAELFLRTHGTYSIKIEDPLKFFFEAIPRNRATVQMDEINQQYLSEFLEALSVAINQLSVDGVRISHVVSRGRELSQYMSSILDESWNQMRGMQIQAVGIASISYDDESTKLINMRNQGAMLGDPSVREGYVQGSVARGMEAAGSNAGGAMAGFVGMGVGMQGGGAFMEAASQSNQRQMQEQAAAAVNATNSWKCGCGADNTGKFCADCGKGRPEKASWKCSCGADNTGKFCADCGKGKPQGFIKCDKCGYTPDLTASVPKFCPECGDVIDQNDRLND